VKKDSYYTLEFQFEKNSDGLNHLFPSMELLIRSLENIDRCLVSSVGYDLQYKRFLKNIGDDSFTFSIRVRLYQPSQFALGQNFPLDDVLVWMNRGRQLFVGRANSAGRVDGRNDLAGTLETLISEFHLDDTILFSPIRTEELSSLSEDLNNAVQFLGGRVRIT